MQAAGYDLNHVNLGILLEQLGKDADAAASYREAIRLYPKHAPAHNNHLFLQHDKHPAAARHDEPHLRVGNHQVDCLLTPPERRRAAGGFVWL